MTILEKMMGFMMSRMSKEDKEEMMDKMMEEFFSDMSAEDKEKLMADMLPKMMEGVKLQEMMPRMMMGMMRGVEGKMGMPGEPFGAEPGSSDAHNSMMHMMATKMMPHCIEAVLPEMPKNERRELVLRLISILVRKGCADMSEEEKNGLVRDVDKRLQSILGQSAT